MRNELVKLMDMQKLLNNFYNVVLFPMPGFSFKKKKRRENPSKKLNVTIHPVIFFPTLSFLFIFSSTFQHAKGIWHNSIMNYKIRRLWLFLQRKLEMGL